MVKKKINTYMVAIQRRVTLWPTLYTEVYATNEKEARIKAGKQFKDLPESDFLEEAARDLRYGSDMGKPKAIGCGKASLYHSPAECEMCAHVEKKSKRA